MSWRKVGSFCTNSIEDSTIPFDVIGHLGFRGGSFRVATTHEEVAEALPRRFELGRSLEMPACIICP